MYNLCIFKEENQGYCINVCNVIIGYNDIYSNYYYLEFYFNYINFVMIDFINENIIYFIDFVVFIDDDDDVI